MLKRWVERGGGQGGIAGQSDGSGAKGKKRVRDPDEPKKPVSSFMLYLAEKKDEVKREQPSLNSRDVSREVGRRWGLLEREEKQVYQERYNGMLVAYKVDLATYRVRKEAQTVSEAAE